MINLGGIPVIEMFIFLATFVGATGVTVASVIHLVTGRDRSLLKLALAVMCAGVAIQVLVYTLVRLSVANEWETMLRLLIG